MYQRGRVDEPSRPGDRKRVQPPGGTDGGQASKSAPMPAAEKAEPDIPVDGDDVMLFYTIYSGRDVDGGSGTNFHLHHAVFGANLAA